MEMWIIEPTLGITPHRWAWLNTTSMSLLCDRCSVASSDVRFRVWENNKLTCFCDKCHEESV
jgi:hypothetical protein